MLKSSVKDIAEYMAAVAMGALFGINIVIVSAFLAKLDLLPFIYKTSTLGGTCTGILILFIGLFYIYGKRYEKVIEKYRDENEGQRLKGNIIISLYVLILFISIFLVAFFKPGYLPK
jgi:hypothetical protein